MKMISFHLMFVTFICFFCDFNIAVFEYLTERYFLDLNTRMIEESKQAVSIGPSLLSSAHLSAQKSAQSSNGSAKGHRTELPSVHGHGSRHSRQTIRASLASDSKRKEKCLLA